MSNYRLNVGLFLTKMEVRTHRLNLNFYRFTARSTYGWPTLNGQRQIRTAATHTEIATVKMSVQIHRIIKIVAVSSSGCLSRITSSTIDRIVIAWTTAVIVPWCHA